VEIEETDKEILVHVEVPGLEKEDCHITVQGNKLCLYGEKRFEHQRTKSTCHIMERAHGTFQRSILLPLIIDEYKAEASYKNGVLTVCLPKVSRKPAISIKVS
jgi:HSP20 family protein